PRTMRPPPTRAFPLTASRQAFRHMAQARHVGKIVLRPDAAGTSSVPALRLDATYLIAGGLGGLGLVVARSLCQRGARHLVLVSRSSPDAAVVGQVEELRSMGAEIQVERADVASRTEMEGLLERIHRGNLPLRGIIHAAGMLDDGVLLNQTWERLEKVLSPK